jgi:hypothetical protein
VKERERERHSQLRLLSSPLPLECPFIFDWKFYSESTFLSEFNTTILATTLLGKKDSTKKMKPRNDLKNNNFS